MAGSQGTVGHVNTSWQQATVQLAWLRLPSNECWVDGWVSRDVVACVWSSASQNSFLILCHCLAYLARGNAGLLRLKAEWERILHCVLSRCFLKTEIAMKRGEQGVISKWVIRKHNFHTKIPEVGVLAWFFLLLLSCLFFGGFNIWH